MHRLPFFIVTWLAYLFLIKLPTIVVGLGAVPLLYPYRHTDYKDLPWWTRLWSNHEDWQGGTPGYGEASLPWWWIRREVATYREPWHNMSNTIGHALSPKWERHLRWQYHVPRRHQQGTGFKSFYIYHALRNGADGLRSFPPFAIYIEPPRIQYKTPTYLRWYEPWKLRELGLKSAHFLCWQGWKAGYKWVYIHDDVDHTVLKLGWRIDADRLLQTRSFATKFLYKHEDQTKAENYDNRKY
jgi:hypothetical protein